MTNPNTFTLTIKRVSRPNGHFLAMAELQIGEAQVRPVMIHFRSACNDWPSAGDRWEVELTGEIVNGTMEARALIRA